MRGLVHLLLFLVTGLFSRTACCGHVVVLQPAQADGDASHVGAHAMIAELALAGFTVSVEKLDPDGDLRTTLAAVARRPGVMAGVSVERRGDVSYGYMWLRHAPSVVIVAERANQAVLAHSVVVLKLTELLLEHQNGRASSRGSNVPVVPSLANTVSRTGPTPPVDAKETLLLFRAWFGVGGGTLAGSRALAPRLGLGLELQWAELFCLTLAGALPLSSHALESEFGSAQVRATELGGTLLINATDAKPFALALGPRLGVRFLDAAADANADANAGSVYEPRHASTRVLTMGADLRVGYRVATAANLALLLGSSWSTPEPRLTNGAGGEVMLGALSWSAMMQAGWELPL